MRVETRVPREPPVVLAGHRLTGRLEWGTAFAGGSERPDATDREETKTWIVVEGVPVDVALESPRASGLIEDKTGYERGSSDNSWATGPDGRDRARLAVDRSTDPF
jgi:hypothetical protein